MAALLAMVVFAGSVQWAVYWTLHEPAGRYVLVPKGRGSRPVVGQLYQDWSRDLIIEQSNGVRSVFTIDEVASLACLDPATPERPVWWLVIGGLVGAVLAVVTAVLVLWHPRQRAAPNRAAAAPSTRAGGPVAPSQEARRPANGVPRNSGGA